MRNIRSRIYYQKYLKFHNKYRYRHSRSKSRNRYKYKNYNYNTSQLVLFSNSMFISFLFKFLFSLNIKTYKLYWYNVLIYLYVFIENQFSFINVRVFNKGKNSLQFIEKKNLYYIYMYIYNIISYYKKYPFHYFNLKFFINIFHNLLVVLNMQTSYDFLLSETFIKIISIGTWSFLAMFLMNKQYKQYKQYKINKNNFNKFFYWNDFYNYVNWEGLFRHLKYSKYGGYNNYKKLKLWIHLNKNLNKKYELVYNSTLNKFLYKYNLYYYSLLNDDGENFKFENIKKKKLFKHFNFNNKQNTLYNLFLKESLDDYSPFFNKELPLPILNLNGSTNKKEFNEFCRSISYEYIATKFNFNSKKSSLSYLSESELFKVYSNFYKDTLSKTRSAINISINNPLIIPSIPYKVFKKELNFNAFFEELDKEKNLNVCSLSDLLNLIKSAFYLICESDDILCENMDYYDEDSIKKDKKDLKYYNNDLQLFMWLNKKAVNDENLLNFLDEFKKHCKTQRGPLYVDSSIFDINLISENEYEPLNPIQLLDLFIHKNFFYLDYFNILVNEQCYSLCYLIFLYKVRKHAIEFETYVEQYSKKTFNQYANVLYNYNLHVNKWVNQLEYISKLNIKYNINSYLFYENINNNNFLFSVKNKKINFKLLNVKNIKNIKKLNFKNDYKNLQFSWDKFNMHFKNYFNNIEYHNIKLEQPKSFEEYYYDLDKDSIALLKNEILELENCLTVFLKYYHFNDKETDNTKILINFEDLNFYLYNIPGFEFAREDTELFHLLKEYDLFEFDINKHSYENSKQALISASIMFFHYVIKNFKNLKTLIASIPNEHLLFNELDFFYQNFDYSMHENRVDFLSHLNNFLPVFKSIITHKDKNIVDTLKFFMMHLKFLEDALEKFPFEKIYDTTIMLSEKDLINLDMDFHHIMDIWRYVLNFLTETRHTFVCYIDLLRYDKIKEFFDFPMFQQSTSFLLLKKNVYGLLKQLIIEERLYDHLYNISVFYYRIYNKPNMYLRRDVLIANGVLPALYYLDVDDLQYIFSIEDQNPLLFIELYNSKQRYLNSELWTPDINFEFLLNSIINLNERDLEFNDAELKNFYDIHKKRDLILYDLTMNDVKRLSLFIKEHNDKSFNQLNIEESLSIIFKQNSLEFVEQENFYKKIIIISSNFNFDKKPKQKKLDSTNLRDVIDSEMNIDLLKLEKQNSKINEIKNKINNKLFNEYDYTIYNYTLDYNIILFEHMDINTIALWKKKVEYFPKSNFRAFLLDKCYVNYKDYELYTDSEIPELSKSLNYLNYLINFYESILKLNELSEFTLDKINDFIINDSFNLLKHGDKEDVNKNFSFNYISLFFKSLKKNQIEENWKLLLNKNYNNKNLFAYFKGYHYLNGLTQFFFNVDQLPSLLHSIYYSNFNYVKEDFYDLTVDNSIDTLYSIFQFLNINILKVNYMFKTLTYFKTILNDIYLNYFGVVNITNNIQIFNELKKLLINETDNVMYLDLINILLYVKDPIYLYNILNVDLKLYLDRLLEIYDILRNPDVNINIYNDVIKLSMFNKNKKKKKLQYYSPFYRGLDFNENYIEDKEIYLDSKLSDFFESHNLSKLNSLISCLILYKNKGFFNLDIFCNDFDDVINVSKDKYLLEKINLQNLFNKPHFIDLFTINNLSDFEFYNINKLKDYFEFNNYFDVKIYHSHDILDYNDLLVFLNLQKERYRFLYPTLKKENYSEKKNIKEFLGFENNNKNLLQKLKKRVSSKSSFYIRDKKYKKVKKKRIWYDEDGKVVEPIEGVMLAHDDLSSYEDVTDEDEDVKKQVEEEVEFASEEDELQKEAERLEAEKRVMHQSSLITILLRDFRQWYSDIEFNEAYLKCKSDFDIVFYQFDHPIWDDIRNQFVNEIHFYRYVTSIGSEDKQIMFDNYWGYVIDKILKKRELEQQLKREQKWFNILNWSITNKRTAPFSIDELCNEFNLSMEYSNDWRRKWNDRNFFLLPKKKDSNYWTEKQWDEFYGGKDIGQIIEYNVKKLNKKKIYKLWDKDNWWKKF